MGSGDVGDGDGRAGDDQAFIDMVSAHMQRNPKLKRSDGIDAMRKTPDGMRALQQGRDARLTKSLRHVRS
jgi:hypothetical protein